MHCSCAQLQCMKRWWSMWIWHAARAQIRRATPSRRRTCHHKPWPRCRSCGRFFLDAGAVALHCLPHLHLLISIPFPSEGAGGGDGVVHLPARLLSHHLPTLISLLCMEGEGSSCGCQAVAIVAVAAHCCEAAFAAAKTGMEAGMKTGAETHISLAIHGLHLKSRCGFGIMGTISN